MPDPMNPDPRALAAEVLRLAGDEHLPPGQCRAHNDFGWYVSVHEGDEEGWTEHPLLKVENIDDPAAAAKALARVLNAAPALATALHEALERVDALERAVERALPQLADLGEWLERNGLLPAPAVHIRRGLEKAMLGDKEATNG